eukprot:TRINITY_DN271_c0_g2_i1.p1 TRINITY_DN271_c0_g2~~TRINITY_DN271_c0_g2_i1.p1  ORF type:complete len:463 (+),score=106.66 TRINITY_DN271_c0_g2_i1:106-1494(+)
MFLPVAAREVEPVHACGTSSDDASSPVLRETSIFSAKRLLAVGAGLLGLGCAGVLCSSQASFRQSVQPLSTGDSISARALLEHPGFIDAASDNVWHLGKEHLAGKQHKLKPAIRDMMSKLSKIIEEEDPEGTRHLDRVQLSPQQAADVLAVVKRMSDRRVQSVGKEVLEIAMKHKDDKLEEVEKEVKSVFTPRLHELKALKESVLPPSARLHGDDEDSIAAEDARRLSSSSTTKKHCTGDTSQCNPGSEITSAMGSAMNMKLEDALALIGGLAEQARLALDEANVIGTSFGSANHHVPYYWRSLIGGLAFGTETLDCFMRQDDVHTTDKAGQTVLKSSSSGQPNSVKMAMCPMKYAGAGMDFISGLNNMMGIQNNRLPQDFQTMFGGAQPQAGYNPYGGGYAAQPQRAAVNPFAMFAPHPATQPAQGFLSHPAAQPMRTMQQPMMHPGAYPAAQHPGFAYPR